MATYAAVKNAEATEMVPAPIKRNPEPELSQWCPKRRQSGTKSGRWVLHIHPIGAPGAPWKRQRDRWIRARTPKDRAGESEVRT
jgi:hypothetical protein